MSETEKTSFESIQGLGVADLRQEVQSLRTLLSCTLVLVFIFSLCVNIFLFRQTSIVSNQLAQANQLMNAWANGGPAQAQAIDFWRKLNDYSRTHPDFMPVINKYSQYINVHPTGAPKTK